ncbi:MAG: ChaN family lipoprotein [Phaeodactylibacter sp.]|uniref:ChaN family lipoprotein n=1 Tax=Phaeodactylibacter sp. TaxID=1940289 RepID=UPI0032F09C71
MRYSLLFFLFLIVASLTAQDKPAYRIFDKKGNPATFEDLLKDSRKSDIVFFGELHNNPIAHWLQYELTAALHESIKGELALGAEMFESDNQLLMDEYLSGTIKDKTFEEEARIWNNYATDYKPLVEFAKTNNLSFTATNIPRRYASLVFKGGFESLEDLQEIARSYIAPLPVKYDASLPGYQKMVEMMGGHGGGSENFPKAQAIKDATMAYFISQNLPEKGVFLHYNGSYHSDHYEGIFWYLKNDYAPKAKITTITTVEQSGLSALEAENTGVADYTIVIIDTMTKTY